MIEKLNLDSEFLNLYLDYVDDTESPTLYHVWSALSAVSACLGRRVYLPFMDDKLFANLFILLVGPPATKKSTAIKLSTKFLRNNTGVRFAPKDTAGQRQGLVAAMHNDLEEGEDVFASMALADEVSLEALEMNGHRPKLSATESIIDLRDRHSMYVAASEFGMFVGSNNVDMLNFLTEMWDGNDYDYKLKSSHVKLTDPLLNMIGGTTPTGISEALPAAAIGQGFMSRIILVWGNSKHKQSPWPKLKHELEQQISDVYGYLFNNFDGPVELEKDARDYYNSIYGQPVEINDPRFVHYVDRRSIHLLKLSIVFASSRLSKRIIRSDIENAHRLLSITEQFMPDALGEYGFSPLAASKQRLVEFIAGAGEPITINTLWTVMHREMKRLDFNNAVADLQNAGKILLVDTDLGPGYVIKEKKRRSKNDDLLDLMQQDVSEGVPE